MSDPVTNAEIEDVLSSIRRLVSEEPLGDRKAGRGQDDTSGKLVLTPALRVAETEEQDSAAEPEMGHAEDGVEATASDAVSYESDVPEASSPAEPEDEGTAEAQDAEAETVSESIEDDAPEEASLEEPSVEQQRPTGILGEDAESTLQRRVAELEAALQQVPDEWEPDGSETELSDETEPLTLEAALSEEAEDAEASAEDGPVDPDAELRIDAGGSAEPVVIEETADLGEDDDALEAAALDLDEEVADVEVEEIKPVDEVADEAETESAEEPDAALAFAAIDWDDLVAEDELKITEETDAAVSAEVETPELAGDIETPEDEAVDSAAETMVPLDDAAIDAMFEDVRPDETPQGAELIEEPAAEVPDEPVAELAEEPVFELADEPVAELSDEPVAELSDELVAELADEPVAELADEPVADIVEEAVVVAAPVDETVEVVAEPVTEIPADEELAAEEASDEIQEPGDEPDETLFELGADETLLDEEALREMVSNLVREELQGVLGERITRNVRRLVRREIQRAMALRDLE